MTTIIILILAGLACAGYFVYYSMHSHAHRKYNISVVKGDITKMTVDVIVNAAKNSLLGGGGVDGAIHAAAGPELLEECKTLNGCETGEAKITKGYNLPAHYVIHTVGPVWQGGDHEEAELLRSCYRSSLALANAKELSSVAFPAISTGIYGYPLDQACEIAIEAIHDDIKFLPHIKEVMLVAFDDTTFNALTQAANHYYSGV